MNQTTTSSDMFGGSGRIKMELDFNLYQLQKTSYPDSSCNIMCQYQAPTYVLGYFILSTNLITKKNSEYNKIGEYEQKFQPVEASKQFEQFKINVFFAIHKSYQQKREPTQEVCTICKKIVESVSQSQKNPLLGQIRPHIISTRKKIINTT